MQLLFCCLVYYLESRVDLSSLTDFAEVEAGVCVCTPSLVSRVVFTVVVFICARWFSWVQFRSLVTMSSLDQRRNSG
jgi:hypothetical protein